MEILRGWVVVGRNDEDLGFDLVDGCVFVCRFIFLRWDELLFWNEEVNKLWFMDFEVFRGFFLSIF